MARRAWKGGDPINPTLRKMIPIFALLIVGMAVAYFQNTPGPGPEEGLSDAHLDTVIEEAFRNQRGNVQVRGRGIVTRILADDLRGSRHQRFLVQLSSGRTLLMAHNIDLAPRVAALDEGDRVEFYGEYEFNPKGGVIHWTHHDPKGRHAGGWIKHHGKIYQ